MYNRNPSFAVQSRAVLLLCTIVTAVICFGQAKPPMSSQVRDVLFKHENELANAEKSHDKAVFQKLLSDDLIFIAFNGWVFNKSQLLSKEQYIDVAHYQPANMKVRTIGNEAAVVTYDLNVNAKLGGRDLPSKQYVSSVWVKSNGGWQLLLHQSTPATHP